MAKKKAPDLNAYRQQVFEQLKNKGYPVEAWQAHYDAKLAQDPLSRRRPFTLLPQPLHGRITHLRPGFTETIPHPKHQHPVPRCQAYRKHTNRTEQCKGFAMKGKHLCHKHGGARGSGIQSPEGRQNQIDASMKHGNETRLKRAQRSLAGHERRELELIGRSIGMISGLGSRGPYFKPNRVGQPMAHLKRKRNVN